MADYKVGKRAPECAVTGEPFEEGEEIVSAIFSSEDGFERRDFKAAAFAESSDCFSYWRGRIPVQQEDTHRLDYDLALDFFRRLVAEDDPERQGLRFMLGLLLGRKRRLKLKGFSRRGSGDGEREFLNLVIRGDEEDEAVSVEVPQLDEEGRAALQAELNRLFGVEESTPQDDPTPQADPTGQADPTPQAEQVETDRGADPSAATAG